MLVRKGEPEASGLCAPQRYSGLERLTRFRKSLMGGGESSRVATQAAASLRPAVLQLCPKGALLRLFVPPVRAGTGAHHWNLWFLGHRLLGLGKLFGQRSEPWAVAD